MGHNAAGQPAAGEVAAGVQRKTMGRSGSQRDITKSLTCLPSRDHVACPERGRDSVKPKASGRHGTMEREEMRSNGGREGTEGRGGLRRESHWGCGWLPASFPTFF